MVSYDLLGVCDFLVQRIKKDIIVIENKKLFLMVKKLTVFTIKRWGSKVINFSVVTVFDFILYPLVWHGKLKRFMGKYLC